MKKTKREELKDTIEELNNNLKTYLSNAIKIMAISELILEKDIEIQSNYMRIIGSSGKKKTEIKELKELYKESKTNSEDIKETIISCKSESKGIRYNIKLIPILYKNLNMISDEDLTDNFEMLNNCKEKSSHTAMNLKDSESILIDLSDR